MKGLYGTDWGGPSTQATGTYENVLTYDLEQL